MSWELFEENTPSWKLGPTTFGPLIQEKLG